MNLWDEPFIFGKSLGLEKAISLFFLWYLFYGHLRNIIRGNNIYRELVGSLESVVVEEIDDIVTSF